MIDFVFYTCYSELNKFKKKSCGASSVLPPPPLPNVELHPWILHAFGLSILASLVSVQGVELHLRHANTLVILRKIRQVFYNLTPTP